MVTSRQRGWGETEEGQGGQILYILMEDLTLGNERTMQYTDDILQNCTVETYIILLTNVTPINVIK